MWSFSFWAAHSSRDLRSLDFASVKWRGLRNVRTRLVSGSVKLQVSSWLTRRPGCALSSSRCRPPGVAIRRSHSWMRPDAAVKENVAQARNGSAVGISRLMWSRPSCSHG